MKRGFTRRQVVPTMGAAMVMAWSGEALSVTSASSPTPLADAALGTVLRPGTHRVEGNLVLKSDLTLLPGAMIEIPAGRMLTVLGSFSAPITQIFFGQGKVDLNQARLMGAHPEWWGATPNDGSDCLPAVHACLQAHPVMLLRSADYFIASTLVIERPWSRIWGMGYRGSDRGQGTRLLVTNSDADTVRVGPAEKPRSVNDFLQGVDMRWMEIGRTRPPGPNAAGLRAQYLLHCRFEGISVRESSTGFAAKGVVRSYFQDCIAFRSLPGTTPGIPYRGFYLGGVENVGLAGANGSIFLVDCNLSIGGSPGVSDAVGLLLEGGFADSFIENFEATSLDTGIRIDGMAKQLGSAAISGHSNLHILTPIIDQSRHIGMDIRNLYHALVDLQDIYIAVAPGARAAIAGQDVHGSCSIVGGQLIGRSDNSSPGSTGLSLSSCTGIDMTALKIADFGQPVRFDDCSRVTLRGQINNPSRKSRRPAMVLNDCADLRIDTSVSGQTKAFSEAIVIDHAKRGSFSIEAGQIDAKAIAGSAIRLGGRQIQTLGEHEGLSIRGLRS